MTQALPQPLLPLTLAGEFEEPWLHGAWLRLRLLADVSYGVFLWGNSGRA